MYDIRLENDGSLIQVVLGGMLSLDEVARYISDLKNLLIGNRLHTYVMIIDVTQCPIQAQEVLHEMAHQMISVPKARAIAIVTGSSLARMQVRRLFSQPYARIVSNLEQGRAWVLEGDELFAMPVGRSCF